jgi:putative membrane protein
VIGELEKHQVAEAIAAVERRTDAELVTVLVAHSDNYGHYSLLWAAAGALLGTPLLLFFNLSAVLIVTIELVAFCVLTFLLVVTGLGVRIVPDAVRAFRAASMARRQFLEQGLHHTTAQTGVLIFVSEAEHYVEILADRGIALHVDPSRWQSIVDRFVTDVRAGRIVQGFLTAIESCGEILAEVRPRTEGHQNQLEDRLVLIGYD